jgi:hypothetical protein
VIRFAPYTESHARDGMHRIERGERDNEWRVFLYWRHVATFFLRRSAREFVREGKRTPRVA